MKIALIPDVDKPDAVAAAQRLREILAADRTAVEVTGSPTRDELAAMRPNLVVVRGDGSILKIAHAMVGIDAPVAGINFGKLGYMAAFSFEQFRRHLPAILRGEVRISQRTMLQGAMYRLSDDAADVQPVSKLLLTPPTFEYLALNEIALNAGEPFRMIELEVQIDGHETAPFRSDGVIVATATGSTGYNLSAGGPLIAPEVRALVLTPICPHSLSFRPVVVADTSIIVIRGLRLNAGSQISFDGQVSRGITAQDCVVVRRTESPLRLLENPEMSHWGMLAHKLHWAQSPRN